MKTQLDIKGIYGWGVGYYSKELSERFDDIVLKYINKHNMPISEHSSDGRCYTVGEYPDNSIYFHPMQVVFRGVYDADDLVKDLQTELSNNITCSTTINQIA